MERGHTQRSFAVSSDAHGEVPVVRVAGEIDLATVAALERELTRTISSEGRVVLDLSECTFIDSTGISAIVRAHKALTGRDGAEPQFAVVVRDSFVTRILKRAGIHEMVGLHATIDDAISAGGSIAGSEDAP